jgi:type IV pilus biogenesis protein CpaD/CtpE
MSIARNLTLAAALIGLSGCAYSQLGLSDDFGQSTRQSLASQIADPDARYAGTPAAGSDGARVALAQDRYRTGRVIQPQPPVTSTIRQVGGGQGGQPGQ